MYYRRKDTVAICIAVGCGHYFHNEFETKPRFNREDLLSVCPPLSYHRLVNKVSLNPVLEASMAKFAAKI
jgi:hypothetical protein